jgi:hypothetical protein
MVLFCLGNQVAGSSMDTAAVFKLILSATPMVQGNPESLLIQACIFKADCQFQVRKFDTIEN